MITLASIPLPLPEGMSPEMGWVLVGGIGLALIATLFLIMLWLRRREPKEAAQVVVPAEFRTAARRMAHGAALSSVGAKAKAKEAATLHPLCEQIPPGLPWGVPLVGPKRELFQGWRAIAVAIIYPGGGKTSGIVVPQALAAPGAVAITSNKVDGVEEIRLGRTGIGKEWVIDPQGIYLTDKTPGCWVNPLRYVNDTTSAEELANNLVSSSTKNNVRSTEEAREDAQFGPTGATLVAWACLAAALSKKPLPIVHEWISQGDLGVIKTTLHDHGLLSQEADIAGFMDWHERTLKSLYATAQRMVKDLSHPHIQAWITPNPRVQEFDPAAFITSTDTLFLLSSKGPGGAGFLITTIVKNIVAAARRSTGGKSRLKTPLTLLLDEVCNIVAWPTLPADSSFFGSLGIVANLFIQGWDQGVSEFGREGMRTLWKNANTKFLGGGEEADWLRGISAIIGDYEHRSTTHSTNSQGTSRSSQMQLRPRITVDQLHNLPMFTGVFFSSGNRPALIRITPWFKDPVLSERIETGNQPATKGRKKGTWNPIMTHPTES